ncbi:MAG: serine protease [Bacilli bacterium]|nr:serine protease [Bacilli bacterium]
MKKRLLFVALLLVGITFVNAVSKKFVFNSSKLSFSSNNKKSSVVSNFNKDYSLSYSISNEDGEEEKEIKNLAKKTTYLLFGDFNNINESSEDYFKRKKDWEALRYNPEIPKDSSNIFGLDTKSQEFADDAVSGMTIAQIFSQAEELGLIYNSYGDIRVTINNNLAISSILLPKVKIKTQSKSDPLKYDYKETNYVMYYYYKKLKDKWKLYYSYGESKDDISNYLSDVESTESKTMSVAPTYQSDLSKVYKFDKLNKLSEQDLNNIYNANVKNMVFFNCYYNNKIIASANGFFIRDGLIVTTWSFLEKSLIDGQFITVKDNSKVLEIEGIVTANPETDLAVIKVKNRDNNSYVKLGNYKDAKVEDPAIVISSKTETGAIVQKGIIISNKDYIQTTIPLLESDEGSPLFNQKGEVIGINTSKATNSSISIAVNSDALKEIQDKFKSINLDKISLISFDELKEKYYYIKYENEKVINDIPKWRWKSYSKIGNVEDTIKLKLIKASYKDGIVSLRYKNNISQYITSMQLATDFKAKLIDEGYKEITKENNKSIYKNNKYQVIIMDEFDYLIVVMVKL